ncbi:hypothetical protein [Actinomycetospora chiangmaiensis]|uniref:hypothetical protein n=1 Tax=Actinomycetospora chiangmaiensis TaxID=402650 RepID=UPI0003A0DEEB|nr:hypothetical protein [Actinomycetospora chiangmaiensis]
MQGSAAPLAAYAEELRVAQQDYARGEQMLLSAQNAAAGAGSGAVATSDAERDATMQARADAAALMDRAEERARQANEVAARALQRAGAEVGAGPTVRNESSSFPADVGNAAASLGLAALRDPLSSLAVAAGGALASLGAVGAVGSVALDLTGVGALAGVPLGAASTAAVVGGVGLAGAGLLDIARHAATDDRVTPFQVAARNLDDDLPDTASGDVLRERTEPGANDRVRQVPDDEAVRALAEQLREDGVPYTRGSYPGTWVTAADGTRIGLRETSGSGGPTLDIEFPNGESWKVHRQR